MRIIASIGMLLLCAVLSASAQVTVDSFSPSNGATGVSTSTVVSITFNTALDTTATFRNNRGFIASFDTIESISYSADAKTVYLSVGLKSDAVYFLVLYYVPVLNGDTLSEPVCLQFTTGSSFPTSTTHSVSGTVDPGSTGAPKQGILVVLSTTPVEENGPTFYRGAITDASGNFTIPYVAPGVYYPVAAYNLVYDAKIDQATGDLITIDDSITVGSADYTGLDLALASTTEGFLVAADSAAVVAARSLPSDVQLKLVQSYDVDSTGKTSSWEFLYVSQTAGAAYRIKMYSSYYAVSQRDSSEYAWLSTLDVLPSLSSVVLPDSVLAKAERKGGQEYRHTTVAGSDDFEILLQLGSLYYTNFYPAVRSLVEGTSNLKRIFWGASYQFQQSITEDSSVTLQCMNFVMDDSTNKLLSTTGVAEQTSSTIPGSFGLDQNYPNPFNPMTSIQFKIANSTRVTLTVYDMLGRQVTTLVNDQMNPGTYTVKFNGERLASGMYLYRLTTASGFSAVRKLVLLR